MPVPYGLELPWDRPHHYAAAACSVCWAWNDLTLTEDGTFICRGDKHSRPLLEDMLPAHPPWVDDV